MLHAHSLRGRVPPALLFRFRILALVVVFFVSSPAIRAQPRSGSPIFPEQETTFSVDPASNTLSGFIYLRNDSDQAELKIALTASDFVSQTTQKGQWARVVFFGPADTTGKQTFETPIPKKQTLPVRIEATGLWEAGQSNATLFNQGIAIGTIKALKYRPAFNVKLVTASNDKPELSFRKGTVQQVILRNDDAMTYKVHWAIAIGPHRLDQHEQVITLAPNSSQVIDVNPRDEWFTTAGYFREEIGDGDLTLSFRPDGDIAEPGLPTKVIPFKAHLNRTSDSWRQGVGYLLIFVVLVIGGVCSLLLHNWVPNQAGRNKLKDRLSQLGDRMAGLSSRIGSKLQTYLRLMRQQIVADIHSKWLVSAELPAILTAANQKCDMLDKVLDQVSEIDLGLHKLEQYDGKSAPSRVAAIESLFRDAEELLTRLDVPQTVLDAAKTKIDEAKVLLGKIEQPDTKFAESLLGRLSKVWAKIAKDNVAELKDNEKTKYAAFETDLLALLGALIHFRDAQAAAVEVEQYAPLERDVRKIELIMDYAAATAHLTNKPQLDRFRQCIQSPTSDSLQIADRIVKQIRERISPDDITKALGSATIQNTPTRTRQYTPLAFKIIFAEANYNKDCAALEDIHCEWTFTHHVKQRRWKYWVIPTWELESFERTVQGWEVWHYFPDPDPLAKPQQVAVKFRKDQCPTPLDSRPTKELNIIANGQQDFGARNSAELVRLSIAIFVALLGLLAGARDQLLKLDLIPAAIAIFLLGFGADVFKNAIAPKDK